MNKSQKTEGNQIKERGVTEATKRKGVSKAGPVNNSKCNVTVKEGGGGEASVRFTGRLLAG